MNPVVRVLVQRAESRRHSLLDLVRVVPDEYLGRTAAGDAWCARDHVIHALAVDDPMARLFFAVASTPTVSELSSAMSRLADARAEAIRERQHLTVEALVATAEASRRLLVEALAELAPDHLDVLIPIPGARTAWGEPLGLTVFQYLEQWANHDSVHEESVRMAVATKPDLSTVALTQRRR